MGAPVWLGITFKIVGIMILDLENIRFGSMQVFIDGHSGDRELVEALLPDPDTVLAKGRVLPGKGRRCVTAAVLLRGQRFLLKKYQYRGLWYGLRHLFKRSRALRVFAHQRQAWLAGVSTPEPLACLERRCRGLLRDCYVLCRYVADSRTLQECWNELTADERSSVLALCGRQLGALHRCGITHGDSNWTNILIVRSASDGIVPWLVDFDCSLRPTLGRRQKFDKDVWHFLRDMRRRNLPDDNQRIFLDAWRASAGSAMN
jgi:tRNA A-37 threonylcarbamoyl transferase component Bud32